MNQMEIRDDAQWQFAGVLVAGLLRVPPVDVGCEVVDAEPTNVPIGHDFPRYDTSQPGGGRCRRCGVEFEKYKVFWPQRTGCMVGSYKTT